MGCVWFFHFTFRKAEHIASAQADISCVTYRIEDISCAPKARGVTEREPSLQSGRFDSVRKSEAELRIFEARGASAEALALNRDAVLSSATF